MMDKRILDLAEKAYNNIEYNDKIQIPKEFIEQFATLIIKECAKQVSNVYKQGGGHYGEKILKHFNIKHD